MSPLRLSLSKIEVRNTWWVGDLPRYGAGKALSRREERRGSALCTCCPTTKEVELLRATAPRPSICIWSRDGNEHS